MELESDAFGHALRHYVQEGLGFSVMERDDGFVSLFPRDLSEYFAGYEEWEAPLPEVMGHVRGKVLDLNANAGKFALYLQGQGHEVVAIDESPLAIEVCRSRGVRDARCLALNDVPPILKDVDTVLLLESRSGFLHNRQTATELLKRFAEYLPSSSRIIVQSKDLHIAAAALPFVKAYMATNKENGRMPGQLRMRRRYLQYSDEWFDILYVSPKEMGDIASAAGWRVQSVFGEFRYVAILERC